MNDFYIVLIAVAVLVAIGIATGKISLSRLKTEILGELASLKGSAAPAQAQAATFAAPPAQVDVVEHATAVGNAIATAIKAIPIPAPVITAPPSLMERSDVHDQASLDLYRAQLAATDPMRLSVTPTVYRPDAAPGPAGPDDDVRTRIVAFPTTWPGDGKPKHVQLSAGTFTTTGVPEGHGWKVSGRDGGADARFDGVVGATMAIAGADGIASFTCDKTCEADLDPQ